MEQTKRAERVAQVIDMLDEIAAMSYINARDYAVENGWAHVVARDIQRRMKFTQLRKFFGSVKHINVKLRNYDENERLDDIESADQERYELLPELAYALGRDLITRDFYDLMRLCLEDKVVSVGDFRMFEKFLSAILAYCKMESLSQARR